jgi:hypothetical protein
MKQRYEVRRQDQAQVKIYLMKEEADALRELAKRRERSVQDLIADYVKLLIGGKK